MDDSFDMGSRRRRISTFFSPARNKSRRSFARNVPDDYSTPVSSRSAQCDWDGLVDAIASNDHESFSEVIAMYPDVNVNQVVPGHQMTLLHFSVGCSDNDTSIVESLLVNGGDPNNANIDEKLSPMHLSALYDFDRVMSILIDYGGDPKLPSGDGHSCFDIVKRNIEEELMENCFKYLFLRSRDFRKSLGTCLGSSLGKPNNSKNLLGRRLETLHESGSDGFYSCESQSVSELPSQYTQSQNDRFHSIARKMYPMDYTNLMTEDESPDGSDFEDDVRKKLTTIREESGQSGALSGNSPQLAVPKDTLYNYTPSPHLPVPKETLYNYNPSPQLAFPKDTLYNYTPSPLHPQIARCRGITSITAPLYLLTDDSLSYVSDSSQSCVNSTPPITPIPTQADLAKLQEQMKSLNIPVTPSTYGVMAKFSQNETKMQVLLSPKSGAKNFSPELQAGLENIQLIHEWGNLKVDFLQSATPTVNMSKSFYNYLLLDPRVIKRVNFSGDLFNTGVICNTEKFQKFLESIFYIGKAHGRRPIDHLIEAKRRFQEIARKSLKKGQKVDKILEIWKSGMGIHIVSVFHHSSEREANVYEASMIDAMGLVELSNLKKGSYAGTAAASWPQKTKNQLGARLLFNCFQSFVVNTPKPFYPADFNL